MKSAPGCFITGTDTGCGKTVATLAVMAGLQRQGRRVAGMKPVASGCEMADGRLVNDDAARIRAACSMALPYERVNPWALADPVSPNFAAARAGHRITLAPVLEAHAELARQADVVVVEGVGGWCVPFAEGLGVADLAAGLALPVLLVVGLRLGCINHAVLTAEAVGRDRGRLDGWIANHVDPDYDSAAETVAWLAGVIDAPCLGEIPFLANGAGPGAAMDGLHMADLERIITV